MSHMQLFTSTPDRDILFSLLEQISYKNRNGNGYVVDVNAYKKMIFMNLHIDFCNEIIKFYRTSKQHYCDLPFTYKAFSTVLRQLCSKCCIRMETRVLYIQSVYTTEYTIYLE
jgi:hypothetical protein